MPLTISAAYPSMVKMLGHSSQPDASLESLSLVSDEYPTSSVVLKSPSKTTSPDPFLGTSSGDSNHKTTRANSQSNIPQVLKKGQNFKVLTQLDKNTLNLATARELIQRLKTESQLQNAHRVPEQKVDSQRELMRSMKRSYGQIVKSESDTTENDSGMFMNCFALHSFYLMLHLFYSRLYTQLYRIKYRFTQLVIQLLYGFCLSIKSPNNFLYPFSNINFLSLMLI